MDKLPLYHPYSRREIRELFGFDQQAVEAWGGQLLILPHQIGLLTAVGPAETAPHFVTPEQFRFRPDQPYFPEDAEYGWMPIALGRHRRSGREVLLFLKETTEDRHLYVGQLGLQMFTGPSDYRHQRVDFRLEPKLPKDLWLRFGGYDGWQLSLNHREYLLADGDLAALTTHLEAVRDAEEIHLTLTRYEEDLLLLRAEKGQAYLRYNDWEGGEWVSLNAEYPEDTKEVASFYCTCGASLDMPLCHVLPRELALETVLAFFRSGAQPSTIDWYSA